MKKRKAIKLLLCLALIWIGCGGHLEPPPPWIPVKANDKQYHYGVGGPAETIDEAKLNARKDLAEGIEVTIESEMKRFVYESDEEFHKETIARSRSYTRQHLPESEIVEIYLDQKTEKYYALARLKRKILIDLVEAPILEMQQDVQNHLRRGKVAQSEGRLIDALTEFGQGWQKALTLPRKFNWLNDQKTERYSEHLENLQDGLVRNLVVRKLSFSENSGVPKLRFCGSFSGVNSVYAVRLPLIATYIEGGGRLRSLSGQEGKSVKLKTDNNGQAEVFISKRGKPILKNRVKLSLDKASIDPLYSLIGKGRVSALLAKEVIVSLSEPKRKYRVAVYPFENLREETQMDWIARYLQDALTNKLAKSENIEVITRIDLPAILKEQNLNLSDLIDLRTATRIGKMHGSTHLVTGTYTSIRARLHVSARLVDVEKGCVDLTAEKEADVIEERSRLNTGFFDLAGKLAYSLAIQLDPNFSDDGITSLDEPPVDVAMEKFKRGLRLQERGQLDEAIELYESGLRLDPNRAEAYNNLGICFRKKNQFGKAGEAYDTAIRLKPRFPEVYNNLGWLLLETGDAERAIEQFQKSIELAPKEPHVWGNLAWAYHVKGDYEKAIETNKTILREDPSNLRSRYNLALAYLCDGQLDAAEREYKIAYAQTSRPDKHAYRSAVADLQSLLENGTRQREVQRMLELLRWK